MTVLFVFAAPVFAHISCIFCVYTYLRHHLYCSYLLHLYSHIFAATSQKGCTGVKNFWQSIPAGPDPPTFAQLWFVFVLPNLKPQASNKTDLMHSSDLQFPVSKVFIRQLFVGSRVQNTLNMAAAKCGECGKQWRWAFQTSKSQSQVLLNSHPVCFFQDFVKHRSPSPSPVFQELPQE